MCATFFGVALFRRGDRVAHHAYPATGGTITEVVNDPPAGAVYQVRWDDGWTRQVEEGVLVRYDQPRMPGD